MSLERRRLLTGFGLILAAPGCGSDPAPPNEPGAKAPSFALQDFQPKSARFGESYGAEEFRGSVLLMPLFSGWCPDCVSCAFLLDQLNLDWQASGLNVRIMAINSIDADADQHQLVDACSFPLLQDTSAEHVWATLHGSKDDHFIYTSDGILSRFYDYGVGERVDVVSPAGKERLRQALISAGA